jgi:outer membrane protein OmpA-like peptidoglycan-associated protein
MRIWQALIAAAAVAAAGCATTNVERDRALAQARAAYQAAQADPHVSRFASGEIAQAGQMIARLEAAAPSASAEWMQHHAYLTAQQAQLARHRAMARAAEAELADAKAERERLVAQAREAPKPDPQMEKLNREVQALRERLDEQRAQAELRSQMSALKARETEKGWQLTLDNDALFGAANRTTLQPGAGQRLERLAQVLKQHPPQEVLIEGYTHSAAGSQETDRAIAEMRAAAVRDALVQHGVEPKRIATRGFAGAEERRIEVSVR